MRIVFISALLVLVLASCNNSKQEGSGTQSKGPSKHSNSFNTSVQAAMDSYHALTEAFVNWDSVTVIHQAAALKLKLDSINFYGFAPNTITAPVDTLALAKKDLVSMAANKSITERRRDLNSLTQHLYNFLSLVQYDEKKIYLNECPMAFDDSIPADWLSENDAIRNPYMGLHHPTYGKAMIECGSNKSVIDFTNKK